MRAKVASGVSAIVLAAGKGTRLKSKLAKVLHPLWDKPLLRRVFESLQQVPLITETLLVVGHQRDQVLAACQQWPLNYQPTLVVQEPQSGTGDALRCVLQQHPPKHPTVLVTSGDTPLLTPQTLQGLLAQHQSMQANLTLLLASLPEPGAYGRVLCHSVTGQPERIVEAKDASADELMVNTVNAGVYVMDWPTISPLLSKLSSNNAQQEWYLTDVLALALEAGLRVSAYTLADANEMLGVNSRQDLALCHTILTKRKLDELMRDGVTVMDPGSTYVSPEVRVAPDVTLWPATSLIGDIDIATGCEIGPNATLRGKVSIGEGCHIFQSWIINSSVAAYSHVGPFAQLRDGAMVGEHVKVGNFVEVKNAAIGADTFLSHFAYVGDATIGRDVNFGAGSITANFDPIRNVKNKTVVEDGAKVGSNCVLVAPVTIGKSATVAAGSVITKDVAPYDLAIARERQTAISGWVLKQQAADTMVEVEAARPPRSKQEA